MQKIAINKQWKISYSKVVLLTGKAYDFFTVLSIWTDISRPTWKGSIAFNLSGVDLTSFEIT